MSYHVLRYEITEGLSQLLDEELGELDAVIVTATSYVDVMQPTAVPYLVVVAVDRESALVAAVRPPELSVSSAHADADVDAFNRWVHEVDADAFADAS